MCVGMKVEDPPMRGDLTSEDSKVGANKQKRRNTDDRKEKAKDAARTRRTQESDYFEDLENLLPVTGPPATSLHTTLDKTSIIRLSVAHLKSQNVLKYGLDIPQVKEEMCPDMEISSCLDGFSLVLDSGGDLIYVSENVSNYIGLTQVELLGQELSDYVHPCDHRQLKQLTPAKTIGSEDELVEIFVRVKCTVTDRGRMINLKQANYKPIKISGKARCMPANEDGGVRGTVFLGVARHVVEREVMVDQQIGVFTSKHSVDMKFVETSQWMSSVAGYDPHKLLGVSFYDLVHALDIGIVQKAFKNLKDHGQCETSPYRLLCCGGGYAWVQTKACLATTRRGSCKGQTISCSYQQISEVINREEILSLVQMKEQNYSATPTQFLENIVKEEITSQVEQTVFEDPDIVQFEIIEDTLCSLANTVNVSSSPSKPQSVIIKPRHTYENDYPSFLVDKKITSAPTSVIVKCRQPEPQVVSVPIFQKTVEALDEKENQKLKSITESLWSNTQTQATDSIFTKKESAYTFSSELLGNMLPIVTLQEQEEIEPKEKDLFEELFLNIDDLEKFAPHSGDQCIPLSKTDSKKDLPTIETVNFDEMPFLDFDDNNKFSEDMGRFFMRKQNEGNEKEFMYPIQKLPLDQNQVLIDPNRNAMWGSDFPDQIRIDEHQEILRPSNGGPGPSILIDDGKHKRDNCPSSTEDCPPLIPKGFKMEQQGKKVEVYRIQDDYCFEPPGQKIVFRPKKEACHPKKRKRVLNDIALSCLSKQSKADVESDNTVSTKFVNMNQGFEYLFNNIEVVTITPEIF
eukprot:GFUD01001360.1.p1 GENE.GFUD01001360.1~~GFUD01001360.1.p1  ORF type:complete len:799 (+),score=187.71 GFUD01001360.1:67-2463(+)